jgi:hypothetical protein
MAIFAKTSQDEEHAGSMEIGGIEDSPNFVDPTVRSLTVRIWPFLGSLSQCPARHLVYTAKGRLCIDHPHPPCLSHYDAHPLIPSSNVRTTVVRVWRHKPAIGIGVVAVVFAGFE